MLEQPERQDERDFASDRPLHTRAHAHAEEALREREAWLSGQSEALEAALNGAPLETSLSVLVRTATALLGGGARGGFYLANAEGTTLRHVVGMGESYAEAVKDFPIGSHSLACGLATHTGQPICTSDVNEEPRWAQTLWLAQKFDYRACWSIPILTSAGKYCGTFAAYWREPHAATPREVEIVKRVSQAAGIIISRHTEMEVRRQVEDARRKQAERMQLLWEAAATLLGADDPDAMLRALFAKIGPQLGVDAYFNYVVDESGDALRLASCAGVPDETAQQIARLEFGESICGTVALEQRPIVAARLHESDDPKAGLARSLGIRALAGNPLLAKGRLLGTLSFASREKDAFDADEVAFLGTLCHYVTVAYDRLRLLDELKEADRRKDQFLATLAHELRNPLAPICNAAQLLRLEGLEAPDLRWSTGVIERQAGHLSRLIEDLLDIARITRNKLELRRQRIELAEVITGVVQSCRALIAQSGHELTVTLPPHPVPLDADVVRLAQVFLNLLNNAAKYTERGGRIRLAAERQGGEVVVSVRDTGTGIPADKLPRLFEMFFQADRSLEKSHGGLGIGLSLVRQLVQLHGGSVEARSEGEGKGSEFIVRLPIAPETGAPAQPRAPAGLEAAPARRILVVDDNHDAADSLALLLRSAGHEVHTAYDGAAGVAGAERLRPDVVLLDVGMPRLNGYDACRTIRAQPWCNGTVLVALTGWGQEHDRSRSTEAGFHAHLVKPVDLGALSRILSGRH